MPDIASEKLPVCFVIMPFSTPSTGNYCDKHFDKIYTQIFEPAIKDAGFKALRTDDFSDSREVKLDIIQNLIDAPMCLCDLSTSNPNVFYELGIRQAFEKPVVLVQEVGQKRVFDVSGLFSTDYRKDRIYDELIEDREKITKAIIDTANSRIPSLFTLLSVNKKAQLDKSTSKDISKDELYYLLNKIQNEISVIRQDINTIGNDSFIGIPKKSYVIDNEKNKDFYEKFQMSKNIVDTIYHKFKVNTLLTSDVAAATVYLDDLLKFDTSSLSKFEKDEYNYIIDKLENAIKSFSPSSKSNKEIK